ncbi:MAG: glycosyltransferase family 39 protein [bacterium]|nr:glycosyltransferase family 39 protein [bacterium]
MVILQIVILLILFFLPGYLVLGKKFQDEEKFGLAFAFSILMYAGTAVMLHLFKIPIIWAVGVFPLSFITIFFRKPTFNIPWKLLLIFGITLLTKAILCEVSKFPTIGDSYSHFLASMSFLTPNWTVLPFTESYWQGIDKAFYMQYRPPLFNLTLGFVFSIFGPSFEIAKLVVVLFTTSILIPVYLVAKRLYDEKCAVYSTILLVTISSFFLSLTFEVFVYPANVYFGFCFFYLYLKKDWNYVAILSALAYLTHPSCVILFLSLILFEFVKNRKIIFTVIKNRNIQIKVKYLYPIVIFILLVSPWLIRNYMVFGNPLHTTGKYAPFGTKYEDLCILSPPTLDRYLDFILIPKNFIQSKLGSVFLTFLPRPYSVTFSTWDIRALWDPVKINWALAGFFTYPLLIVIIYFLIRRPTEMIPFLFYIGMLISFFLMGYRAGYMQTFILSHCVLLGIWGINIVKNSRIFICIIGIMLILQCVGIIYDRGKQKEIPDYELYSWIKNNVPVDEKIMNCDAHTIAYFTGRSGFITPYEDRAIILHCLENWDVHYLIVGPTDLRLRDIDIKEVEKRYKFLTQIQETRIYKVR